MLKANTVLLILGLISCGDVNRKQNKNLEVKNNSNENVTLLSQLEQQDEHMEALTTGILTLDQSGCLKINNNTLIWPYGYQLGENKLFIINKDKKRVAKIGDHLEISGGECSNCEKDQIQRLTGTIPNIKCHGNYWIVGEEIRTK